jgi:hypothetical protein
VVIRSPPAKTDSTRCSSVAPSASAKRPSGSCWSWRRTSAATHGAGLADSAVGSASPSGLVAASAGGGLRQLPGGHHRVEHLFASVQGEVGAIEGIESGGEAIRPANNAASCSSSASGATPK